MRRPSGSPTSAPPSTIASSAPSTSHMTPRSTGPRMTHACTRRPSAIMARQPPRQLRPCSEAWPGPGHRSAGHDAGGRVITGLGSAHRDRQADQGRRLNDAHISWASRPGGAASPPARGVLVSDLVDALSELPALAGALAAVVVDGVVQPRAAVVGAPELLGCTRGRTRCNRQKAVVGIRSARPG
jgi:hypothetical protein